MLKLSVLLAIFLTVACGSDSDSGTDLQLDGKKYVVLDGTPQGEATDVSGTGEIAFSDPVAEKGKNFDLSFSLEDGGSLALTTFGDNALDAGIGLQFTRTASTLAVVLQGPSGDVDASPAFAGVDASQTLAFFIDIHNDETPAHIVVWKQDAELGSPLLNSEEGYEAPGNGTDRFWGLTLAKAAVSTAQVGDPKLED